MPKILITARLFGKLHQSPMDLLINEGFEIKPNPYHGSTLTETQLLELIDDVDGALIGDDYFTSKVIKKATKLKVLSKYGVGVDRVDVKTATKNGIAVTNAPGSNKHAVADYTIGLMLSLSRKIDTAQKMVKNNQWKVIVGHEIYKKTLGIIGFGAIGQEVAKRAAGFQMNILAYDPFARKDVANSLNVRLLELKELLSSSDIVTLHAPSLPATKNIINSEHLALMKPTAYLINTARGDLIDEEALLETLRNERIAGAALDTLKVEPPIDNPFDNFKNVIVTPHIAGHSYEANYQMATTAAKNLINILNGQPPLHIVNRLVLSNSILK